MGAFLFKATQLHKLYNYHSTVDSVNYKKKKEKKTEDKKQGPLDVRGVQSKHIWSRCIVSIDELFKRYFIVIHFFVKPKSFKIQKKQALKSLNEYAN